LEQLKNLTRLRWLYLVDTAVTDAGLLYLKDLSALRELQLEGTKVTDAGHARLKRALPRCHIVR
jgi:internalin A